jgi:hypothetical protein
MRCHAYVTGDGHDARTKRINRRNVEMECEEFLEPPEDQEYDDDL